MVITLIRVVILYAVVIFCVRFMGKRQIGEMKPAEFVITILLSEIAAMPMQDNDLPLLPSILAVFILASFEVINSFVCIKSRRYRSILEGNPIIVIRNGVLDLGALKRLRYSADDLLEAMRDKNIFDVSQVQYAILETTGKLSILQNPQNRNVTAEMLDLNVNDGGLPCTVIYNGKIICDFMAECGMDEAKVTNLAKRNQLRTDEIMLMTVDRAGKAVIIKKDGVK